MPAQSVVATRSYSRLSRLAREAKNGSKAFFVSEGVGCSGPTPNRIFAVCPSAGCSAAGGARSSTSRTTTSVRRTGSVTRAIGTASGYEWWRRGRAWTWKGAAATPSGPCTGRRPVRATITVVSPRATAESRSGACARHCTQAAPDPQGPVDLQSLGAARESLADRVRGGQPRLSARLHVGEILAHVLDP